MRALPLLLPVLLLTLVGCDGNIPDPNDPAEVGLMQPEVLTRNLKWASDAANERVAKHEITDTEAKEMISKYAAQLLDSIKVKEIESGRAWEYAEVFRTARQWDAAEKIFRVALESDKTIDRKVNDSLRLAYVLAQQGKVEEAIKTARSIFKVPANETAPILMSVYLELVPVARGKKHDVELGKLVEDAISLHEKTEVDPRSNSGEAFIQTRPYHVNKAWQLVYDLYNHANRPDLVDAARKRQMSHRA